MLLKSVPLLILAGAGFVLFASGLCWLVVRLLRSNRKAVLAQSRSWLSKHFQFRRRRQRKQS